MATAHCLPLHQFDASYISKLGARDSGVEAHFAQYFSRFLAGSLRRRAASADRINDVRQETFARVLAAVHSDEGIRRPECFGAFVAAVCKNVLYESYRSDRYESMDDLPPLLTDPVYSPEAIYTASESQRQVRQVLRHMQGEEGQLLRAVYLEERDRDEVCRELGISRGYLRVLLHRAKQQFRDRFKQENAPKSEVRQAKSGQKAERRARTAKVQRINGPLARNFSAAQSAEMNKAMPTKSRTQPRLMVIPGGLNVPSVAHA